MILPQVFSEKLSQTKSIEINSGLLMRKKIISRLVHMCFLKKF